MDKPVIPALPDLSKTFKPFVPISGDEIRKHYTRLQILTRTNAYSVPDTLCTLNEMKQNRTKNDAYKKITVSQFLAISLVRYSHVDVVAVSMDQVSPHKIEILIARNESTSLDSDQAKTLRQLFLKHFINSATKEPTEEQFSMDYLTAILGWSSDRITTRLTALNYAGANKPGPKSKARSEKLLNLEKILSALSALSALGGDDSTRRKVKDLEKRYTSNLDAILLRGDKHILRRSKDKDVSFLDVVYSWLRFIKDAIGRFHKKRRLGEFDVSDFTSLALTADILGSSRIFEDVLDLTGSGSPAGRFQFCRSLRKVGVYWYGVHLLFKSMTSCRGRHINEIDVVVIPSPENVEVACIPDWYGFVREEFRAITHHELTASQAFLESTSDLNKYQSETPAALHAELNLALYRKRTGLKTGEIGVSKDCCSTCLTGLSHLKTLGFDYFIKGGHDKPYVARLTGFDPVDRAIITGVEDDFIRWLKMLEKKPDSDVSDHNSEIESLPSWVQKGLDEITISPVGH